MPLPTKLRQKAGRTVRHTLKDGTVKVYQYDRHAKAAQARAPDCTAALIAAYQRSPEWRALAESTRTETVKRRRPPSPPPAGFPSIALPPDVREAAAMAAGPWLATLNAMPRGHALGVAVHLLAMTLHRWDACEIANFRPCMMGTMATALADVEMGLTAGNA